MKRGETRAFVRQLHLQMAAWSAALVFTAGVLVYRGYRPDERAAIIPGSATPEKSPPPPVQRRKARARPHSPLRETAVERERIERRLHEFGLKREFFAMRGVAGKIAPLVSQKDLDAATRSFNYATVLTSDHSQRMVSYSKLTGSCPELSKIRGRAALKLDQRGKVIDGAYLPDSAPIPRSVIGCQVGKPSDLAGSSETSDSRPLTFVTIFTPSLEHAPH